DQLAQDRLLQAAFAAGYETVYLQQEPVAAAYSYETTLSQPENMLVFDFGGGTLDLTVMRLGDAGREKVLATGGIPVAGDVFDQKLVRAKLPRHFGEGSFYGPRHKRLTMPRWIFDAFSDWQTILELQAQQNRQILEDIARTAQRRYQIEALLALVSGNYGLKMFDIVEQAKRTLSEKRGAEILLEGEGFHVRDFVTRTEFERIIGAEIRAIDEHIDEVVTASGLAPEAIDRVIRTGGSAQIPVFHEMLGRKFGADKVRAVDTFSSVTAGLGVIAHGIERGEIDGRAFTPDDITWAKPADEHRPNVPPVNLGVLQKRIALAEGDGERRAESGERGMVLVGGECGVTAVPFQEGETAVPAGNWFTGVIADWDEQLLLITTHYRFILMTPRQLAELQTIGLTLADMHRLDRQESVCAVNRWAAITGQPKMLLVTSAGLARPYPTPIMRDNIETPVPWRFDRALDGVEVAALGAAPGDWLALISQKGRGVRWRLADLRGSGTQAFNCGADDRVIAASLAAELALVTADGYGRRLAANWVPIAAKPTTKGQSLIARRSPVTAVWEAGSPAWLVTNEQVVLAEDGRLSRENATKTKPLLKLSRGEHVLLAVNK
ncbi:MAG: Hsp70 family protein, partial [Anaerolineae bacterium]